MHFAQVPDKKSDVWIFVLRILWPKSFVLSELEEWKSRESNTKERRNVLYGETFAWHRCRGDIVSLLYIITFYHFLRDVLCENRVYKIFSWFIYSWIWSMCYCKFLISLMLVGESEFSITHGVVSLWMWPCVVHLGNFFYKSFFSIRDGEFFSI